MKCDIKSVVIGVLGSALLMLSFGYKDIAGGDVLFVPSSINWALVVPPNAKVLAKGYDGRAFIIDVGTSTATRIEYDPKKNSLINEFVILGGKD